MRRTVFSTTAICVFFYAMALTIPVAAAAESVRGRVIAPSGLPVENARVEVAGGDVHTFSDSDGMFAIDDCPLPCTLVVTHPRFHDAVAERNSVEDGSLEVALESKNAYSEQVVVTASRAGGDTFAPESVASTVIAPTERAAVPATLTELVESVPGVSENGQGGHFQVFSIRGISRQRVMTLVDGMRMTSERRAGISTSFVDPLLMGEVDVVRGPASTYYGSGALGGVVQIFPRRFDEGVAVELGYDSHGDENVQMVGWGNGTWSVGAARRHSDNDENADGEVNLYRFTQLSATIAARFEAGPRQWEVLLIPARGTNIGKPNSEFPDRRPVIYPEENHLLFRVGMTGKAGWSFQAWGHPQDLETRTERIGESLSLLETETFDFGSGVQRNWRKGRLNGVVGAEYFGRRGVESRERIETFEDGSVERINALDGAEEDELGLFGSARWNWGSASFQSGLRMTLQRQNNAGFRSRDDEALTGFIGVVRPLGKGYELTANVGSGLRFPTLSERFFSGNTPRGGQIGNPDLDPERSLSADIGIRYFGDRLFLAGGYFRQDIDDYIERIRIDGGVRTFVNLTEGTIDGLELEGFFELDDAWRLTWGGHAIDGEAEDGTPLADIPAARVDLGAHWSSGRFEARAEAEYRFEKDDPGDGEVPIGDALLFSASLGYEIVPGARLVLRGRNLTDESYFNSADDLAIVSPGRSVGLSFSWRPGSASP